MLTRAALCVAAMTFVVQAQKNPDIFLLIGQSNMSGRGTMIPSDYTTDIPGTWLLKDSLSWELARNSLNKYSTLEYGSSANEIGPGFGFSNEMHRLLPNTDIGLVVNARGGSAIGLWLKGGSYYADAVARAKGAMKSGNLKAILWHQGESDAADTNYVRILTGLIDSLRIDLGKPTLPFIAGQLGQWEPKFADFNARILKLPTREAQTAVVHSDSLVDKGDKLHFDRPGQLVLGTRYAQAVWDIVYAKTSEVANPSMPLTPTNTGEAAPSTNALGERIDGHLPGHVGQSPRYLKDGSGKNQDRN